MEEKEKALDRVCNACFEAHDDWDSDDVVVVNVSDIRYALGSAYEAGRSNAIRYSTKMRQGKEKVKAYETV